MSYVTIEHMLFRHWVHILEQWVVFSDVASGVMSATHFTGRLILAIWGRNCAIIVPKLFRAPIWSHQNIERAPVEIGNVHNPLAKSENVTTQPTIGAKHKNGLPFARYLTRWAPDLVNITHREPGNIKKRTNSYIK